MDELLANPAVQSGIVPLIIATGTGLLLRRFGWYWASLGFVLAFYSAVYLVIGFDIAPLTSTRKILIAGLIAFVIGIFLDFYSVRKPIIPIIIGILAAIGVVWVLWNILKVKEGSELWVMALSSIIYIVWLTVAFQRLQPQSSRISVAIFALAIGTGASAMLGASALLGQLAIAIGAIAGVFILLAFFFSDIKAGNNYVIPGVVLSAYLGIGGVIFARIPWYSLLPLALIPLIAQLLKLDHMAKYKQILLVCACTLPLSALSIFLTWQQAGESSGGY